MKMRFKVFGLAPLLATLLWGHAAASPFPPRMSFGLDSPIDAAEPSSYQTARIERTLTLIKPDATRRNLTEVINDRFKNEGLKIVVQKKLQLTPRQVEVFYEKLCGQSFYPELCRFMSSGPIVAQVIEGENVINITRKLIGATNPAKANKGTIRGDFGCSFEENCVHGSDSPKTAADEIAFFFSRMEFFN